jgi:hypothetical protein
LFESESIQATIRFLGTFWPIADDPAFLRLIARETWRTVAMATVGISLALVLAIPLSLIAARVLSLSALTGTMDRVPFWIQRVGSLGADHSAQHSRTRLGPGVCSGGWPGPDRGCPGYRIDVRGHAWKGICRNSGKC